jgi:peroxiredoxin
MKHLIPLSLVIILAFVCKAQTKGSFTESDNRIELNALRQSVPVNNSSGFGGMSIKGDSFWDNVSPDVKGVPDSLTGVKIYYQYMNYIQALYQSYKAGKVSKGDFEEVYQAWGSDTTDCIPGYVKTFVVIATGVSKTGHAYYLFDSDNDFDLGDEILYESTKSSPVFHNINTDQPHKVIYEKVINGRVQQDSTWIAFYEYEERLSIQLCEIATATFQFDSTMYKIKVRPSTTNGYRKGTTYNVSHAVNKKSKNYDVGEYLKLGNSYYKLSCSSDGLKIFLTKDKKALVNGSTQIGMTPINFKVKTYTGNSINFPSDFKGKYVLLDFWSTSCGPCVQEIRDYYIDIYKKYGGRKFEIIGIADNLPQELDDFIKKYHINWIIIPDGAQRAIQKKYNIFTYPTLYLINPEGVIISKDNELRFGKFESILEKNIKTK